MRIREPSLLLSGHPATWSHPSCTLSSTPPITSPGLPALRTWSSRAVLMVRLLLRANQKTRRCEVGLAPGPAAPPLLCLAPHLSSRASWTDCSRLLGRGAIRGQLFLLPPSLSPAAPSPSLTCSALPSPAASIPPPTVGKPRQKAREGACERAIERLWGREQTDRQTRRLRVRW